MLVDCLFVLAGGLAGGPTRYLTGVAVKSRVHTPFPFGTLTVNGFACLLLGFLSEAAFRGALGPHAVLLLATGFCGALSTLSTFSYEVFTLTSIRRTAVAGIYLTVTFVLGIGMSFAGAAVARGIW
ncbi:fluoride efflux transporter FluC [Kitasatospora sp. NPDC004531]